jgi:hypothetical protein
METITEDLDDNTKNANQNIVTEIEIKVASKNQLSDMFNNIITEDKFEPVMSKSKKMRKEEIMT